MNILYSISHQEQMDALRRDWMRLWPVVASAMRHNGVSDVRIVLEEVRSWVHARNEMRDGRPPLAQLKRRIGRIVK